MSEELIEAKNPHPPTKLVGKVLKPRLCGLDLTSWRQGRLRMSVAALPCSPLSYDVCGSESEALSPAGLTERNLPPAYPP